MSKEAVKVTQVEGRINVVECTEPVAVKLSNGETQMLVILAILDNRTEDLKVVGERIADWIRDAATKGKANSQILKELVSSTSIKFRELWHPEAIWPCFCFLDPSFERPRGHLLLLDDTSTLEEFLANNL